MVHVEIKVTESKRGITGTCAAETIIGATLKIQLVEPEVTKRLHSCLK